MCIANRSYICRLILFVVLSVDGSPKTDVIDINPNSHTAALDLLAHLTNTQIYDKFSSPTHSLFKHQSDIINVRLHVYYIKLKSAPQLQFDIQFLIQLRWKDERLSFATKNLLDITKISGEKEFLDHIWSPNIYLANERSSLLRGKQNKDVTVNILPDGTVLCDSRIMTSVVCGVKLGKFPLDQQKCYFNIETWNYTLSDLLLQWENDSAISISKETPFLAEYELVSAVHLTDYNIETDSEIDNVHSCNSLRVMFVVSRKYGFYLMNYYVPSILIVAISWVTFWESPEATPGRCILGATTMLSFIFLGVEMSKSLPSKTYIRTNDIWFIGCTAFIFCALAEFAFANSLWRYGGEVELKKRTSKYILKSSLAPPKEALKPRRRSLSCPSSPMKRWENPLKRVVNNELTVKSLSDLEISLPLSELKTMKKETIEISEKPEPPPTTMSWQDIAVWIDKKSRIVFPICFLTFNIIYWGLLCIS